jgi:hypothetical protein
MVKGECLKMEKITIDRIMDLNPCSTYTRERVTALFDGRDAVSCADILDFDIPAEDRVWAVVRLVPKRTAHEFAISCAEAVVHLTDDPRPQVAIDAAKAYLKGEISIDGLRDAADAVAWATRAATDAAWATRAAADAAWATRAAAYAATDAAWATRAAAYAAAYAADAAADAADAATRAAADAADAATRAAADAADAEKQRQIQWLKENV